MNDNLAEKLALINKLITSNYGIKIQTLYWPFTDFDDVDFNFRKIIFPSLNKQYDEPNNKGLDSLEDSKIYLLKSLVGFQNIVFRLPDHLSDCILIFGPFLSNQHSDQIIRKIIRKNHFPKESQILIRNYLDRLPVVNASKLLHNIQLLAEDLVKKEIPILFYDFSNEQLKEIKYNPDTFDYFAKDFMEEIADKKRLLLANMNKGNAREAIKTFHKLENMRSKYEEFSASKWRQTLLELRIQCEVTLLEKHVPYGNIKRMFDQFDYQIQRAFHVNEFEDIADQTIMECCKMILSNDYSDYSFMIRNVMKICQNNIHEPLSLSYLAKAVYTNASVLSNQFKKETGTTLTQYIQREKMMYAKELLMNSKKSVQAIAEELSYFDHSYFSKVYKKVHGVSPIQTRKEFLTLVENKFSKKRFD